MKNSSIESHEVQGGVLFGMFMWWGIPVALAAVSCYLGIDSGITENIIFTSIAVGGILWWINEVQKKA